ncbi:MAG: hypothetical protein JKY31_05355 [Rhodobacteraceae bacterium]|nr:hypothetical protein [Paracoccaceae bacterium]
MNGFSIGSNTIFRSSSLRFALFLIALTLLEAALTLLPGRLLITGHEGDLLHMIDAGLRMADGELPHLDFMTPIGILGIAPVAVFLKFGAAAGQAAILANLLVCILLLPATWWLGATRFNGGLRFIFGAMIIVLCTALVHGGGSTSIALSMYYNRWCWAVSLLILVATLLPPTRNHTAKWVDPFIIGLGMATLALTKMTFFVPLAPAIILVLIVQRQFGVLWRSLLIGALAGGVSVLLLGVDFMVAYAHDLMAVAADGAGRAYPTNSLVGVLASPKMITATVVLLFSIILFRKAGRYQQGLILMIVAPAFVYITYQNWGNDPKWLYFSILYLLSYLPEAGKRKFLGLPQRQAGIVLVTIAVTAIAPSAMSLIGSTSRSAFADYSTAMMIPLEPNLADLWMPKDRILVTNGVTPVVNLSPLDDTNEQVLINGSLIPDCHTEGGLIALIYAQTKELEGLSELAGKQVLVADILNVGWLLGDISRVDGAATWYYDDTSGFDSADYFMVPSCPLHQHSRTAMVEKMLESGWALDMRYSSKLMVLYQIVR